MKIRLNIILFLIWQLKSLLHSEIHGSLI